LHQSPKPTVNPWSLIGALYPFPTGKHFDDAWTADLEAVGAKGRHPGIYLAIQGFENHRRTVILRLDFDPLSWDDQNLTDLKSIWVRYAIGPHELVHSPIKACGDLPKEITWLYDHRSGAPVFSGGGPHINRGHTTFECRSHFR
tara:strand:+ start:171 stop:602 length:432 start_codon:yes stop_codon:yes gene_type:complete